MDVDEKQFLDQFLILYIIVVQKIPTLRLVNIVRVNQSLQPHVNQMDTLCSYFFLTCQFQDQGQSNIWL